MRYPFRAIFVDGVAVGVLVDIGGRLDTTYWARAYFAEARRPEPVIQGLLSEAAPDWLEPSVRATGTVTLGETQTSDDLPEMPAGLSPEWLAAWRTLRAWLRQRLA